MTATAKKMPWRQWAVEFIKRTQKCPGEPGFGSTDTLVTEEQFVASIQASGTHPFADCHFMDDLLGIKPPLPDMKPLHVEGTDDLKFTEEDMQKFKRTLLGGPDKVLAQFKKNLIQYVNMIEIRNGELHIPDQIMNLRGYTQKFFDVQE